MNSIFTPGWNTDRWSRNDDLFKTKFKRLTEITQVKNWKMFGPNNTPEYDETKQGQLGNCYFISAIAAVSGYPDLIKSAFLIKEVN